ncbi:hypothetical protein [Streptomyces sp. NPDC051183]|uniref:hypothetical protein n=1 Tax=Streptomyces sp. NPDC051183 TaxID=3155165 RepID=UPI003414D457
MVAVLTEAPPVRIWPAADEHEPIQCERCGQPSSFPDDADAGAWAAHDQGWHVATFHGDTCGCPHLCADCAHDWCAEADDSPRLIGMRVIG